MPHFPPFVKIVEVAPRDGLQNEHGTLCVQDKLHFIHQLEKAGLTTIEAGSFVSPQKMPQMANTDQVLHALITEQKERQTGTHVHYPVLVPNLKGLNNALKAGANAIALFTSCSETFNQHNIHCSIEQSFSRFEAICHALCKHPHPVTLRGYISCVLGCPYEGPVSQQRILSIAKRLLALGCSEISLGDTIGVGTPQQATQLITYLRPHIPLSQLAVHFHNTYGQALVNIYAALEAGIFIVDAAVSGLGGCPYAKHTATHTTQHTTAHTTGNVATEEVVYMLHGLDIQTGIDLPTLCQAGQFICQKLQCPSRSPVCQALQAHNTRLSST